jgi:hypothetical protein
VVPESVDGDVMDIVNHGFLVGIDIIGLKKSSSRSDRDADDEDANRNDEQLALSHRLIQSLLNLPERSKQSETHQCICHAISIISTGITEGKEAHTPCEEITKSHYFFIKLYPVTLLPIQETLEILICSL